MNKITLTPEEIEIENNSKKLRPASTKNRKRVEKILSKASKNRAISLRISSHQLQILKNKAETQGIPYQTLITSVLHRYINNELLDRQETLKSIQNLQETHLNTSTS